MGDLEGRRQVLEVLKWVLLPHPLYFILATLIDCVEHAECPMRPRRLGEYDGIGDFVEAGDNNGTAAPLAGLKLKWTRSRDRRGRDPPGLRASDARPPHPGVPGFDQKLRYLRRLSRSGLSLDHHDLILRHRVQQLLLEFVDGQLQADGEDV